MIDHLYRACHDRAYALAGRFVAGRGWVVWVALVGTALAMLSSWPRYEDFYLDPDQNPDYIHGRIYRAIEQQIDHPLTPHSHPPVSHEAKRAFRITVPLLAHLLGLRFVDTLVLQHLLGPVFLGALALLLYRLTDDRALAAIATLGWASTYPAKAFFVDLVGQHDGYAYLLLTLAMLSRRPWLIALWLVLAGFVDERALVATPVVFLWWWWRDQPSDATREKGAWRTSFRAGAVVGAVLICLLLRVGLWAWFGLSIPMPTEDTDVGLAVLRANYTRAPLALLGALEGHWAWLLLGVMGLLFTRRYLWALLFGGAALAQAMVAAGVYDLTRSAGYLFVGALFGMAVFSREGAKELRPTVLAIAVICWLFPTYWFIGRWYAWLGPALPRFMEWWLLE